MPNDSWKNTVAYTKGARDFANVILDAIGSLRDEIKADFKALGLAGGATTVESLRVKSGVSALNYALKFIRRHIEVFDPERPSKARTLFGFPGPGKTIIELTDRDYERMRDALGPAWEWFDDVRMGVVPEEPR